VRFCYYIVQDDWSVGVTTTPTQPCISLSL